MNADVSKQYKEYLVALSTIHDAIVAYRLADQRQAREVDALEIGEED